MYGRAPRALTIPISGTADDIGPGTYWPNEDAMRRKAGKNFYLSSFDEIKIEIFAQTKRNSQHGKGSLSCVLMGYVVKGLNECSYAAN